MPQVYLAPTYGAGWQGLDASGNPLNAGKLYTYQANSTTPLATYTTNLGTVQNANPIILNGDGRPPSEIWFIAANSYKVQLQDSAGNVIETRDNLPGVNDFSAIQNGSIFALSNVAGTNVITGTGSPTVTALSVGQLFTLNPANTNTNTATLQADSTSAKNVFFAGSALGGNELRQNVPAMVDYDGTRFNIVGPFVGGAVPAPAGFNTAGKALWATGDANNSYVANTSTANAEFVGFNAASHQVTIGVNNVTILWALSSAGVAFLGNTSGAASEAIAFNATAHTVTLNANNTNALTAGTGSTGIKFNAYTSNGTLSTTGSDGTVQSASDETLKDDEGGLKRDPLEMLAPLRAHYYFWKDRKSNGDRRQLGFFAQEVNAALGDEAANPPPEGAYWGYYDRAVIAVAVEAVNALNARLIAIEADYASYKLAHP